MTTTEVTKKEKLYEGKAKRLYETDRDGILFVEFKDDLTAFDGEKAASMEGKGAFNNKISAALMQGLEEAGVATHFVEKTGENTQLVKDLDMIPLEVVVRSIIAGSLSRRTGLDEGTELDETIVEFYYKRDDLGDPLLNDQHITKVLDITDLDELDELRELGLKVNDVLSDFFGERGIDLVDFKLEFGRDADGNLVLGDEVTPDTCRLWDAETGDKLDKDRFRRDLGSVGEAYEEILERVGG